MLQVRKRLLTLAGYPSVMDGFSVVQLLDAAERAEQDKYNLERHEPTKHNGDFVLNIKSSSRSYRWYMSEDGKLLITGKYQYIYIYLTYIISVSAFCLNALLGFCILDTTGHSQ